MSLGNLFGLIFAFYRIREYLSKQLKQIQSKITDRQQEYQTDKDRVKHFDGSPNKENVSAILNEKTLRL